MGAYEFIVRVEHPNDVSAAQHIELLRESVHAHATVIHSLPMQNGTVTISPTRKLGKRRKK